MRLILGAVADDYTGASDLANTLARNGLRTAQIIGVPGPEIALQDLDAIVIALKSRSIPAANAVAMSRKATDWLRRQGARHVMFKICSTFDSTDAGNIGPVIDALRRDCGCGPVIVTPAFPLTGRTVFQSHLFVGAVPLNESPMRDHPLNPMRDADLRRVLARQSAYPVGAVDVEIVEQGSEAIGRAMTRIGAEGAGSAILDAIFDRHLHAIGLAALENPLSVGASGLGLGIARALADAKRTAPVAVSAGAVGGKVALLAGSCSKATLEQIKNVEGLMPVRKLDAARLLAGAPEVENILQWAVEKLDAGPLLIASSSEAVEIAAFQARFPDAALGERLEQAFADIAAGLVAQGVRRLIVAGGETSGAVVDRLGLKAFLIGPEIAPGVPVLITAGGEPDMRLALKSGNFGGPDFFIKALSMMG
jgi:uncharacterized protein YgbK (DUF1537 family)